MKKSILSSKILLLTSNLLLLLLTVGCGKKEGCGKNFSKERKKNTTIHDTEWLEGVIKKMAGGALSISQNNTEKQDNKSLEELIKRITGDALSTSQNNTEKQDNKSLKEPIKKEVVDSALPTPRNTEKQGVGKSIGVTGNTVSVLNQETDKTSQVGVLNKVINQFYNKASLTDDLMKEGIKTLHEEIDNQQHEVQLMYNTFDMLEEENDQYSKDVTRQMKSEVKKITQLLSRGLEIIGKAKRTWSDKSNTIEKIAIELQKHLDELLPLHQECEILKNALLRLENEEPDLRLAPGITQMLAGLTDINKNIQNNDNIGNLLKQLLRIWKIYDRCENMFISLLEREIRETNMVESYILNIELAYAHIYGFTVLQQLLQKIEQHSNNTLSIEGSNTLSIEFPFTTVAEIGSFVLSV